MVDAELCPIQVATVCMSTPARIHRVAAVWRRSWKRPSASQPVERVKAAPRIAPPRGAVNSKSPTGRLPARCTASAVASGVRGTRRARLDIGVNRQSHGRTSRTIAIWVELSASSPAKARSASRTFSVLTRRRFSVLATTIEQSATRTRSKWLHRGLSRRRPEVSGRPQTVPPQRQVPPNI